MKKGRFDNRTWMEIVGDLVSERTSNGDSIKLDILYHGNDKPEIKLWFVTTDPVKVPLDPMEELTDWLPEKPFYYDTDESGNVLDYEFQKGFTSWKDYMHMYMGPGIQKIVAAGGRYFTFEEN